MEDYPCTTDKLQIGHEILRYLVEHPESQDTIEGIAQWWLLERKIKHQKAAVKEAVSDLMSYGFVLEQKKRDLKKHYRINKSKADEIKKFLKTLER